MNGRADPLEESELWRAAAAKGMDRVEGRETGTRGSGVIPLAAATAADLMKPHITYRPGSVP